MKVVKDSEKPAVKKEPTFGEQFDFNVIFRVKGKQGLVGLISHKIGAKTCVVCEIYNPKNKRSERTKNMVGLGNLKFIKKDQEELNMQEVFTNISQYCITADDYYFESTTIEELMSVMVPDYDENRFKKYHAEQVLSWYIEITTKYSALIDSKVESGEIEIIKEEDKP